MQIFISRGGETFGPYSEEQVRQMLDAGQLLGEDLGWIEGMADWLPVNQLLPADLPVTDLPATEPTPESSPVEAKKKSKLRKVLDVAALLVFLVLGVVAILAVRQWDQEITGVNEGENQTESPVVVEKPKTEFEKTLALVEAGDLKAQSRLADCYFFGDGVGVDHVKSLDWATMAADQGDANAKFRLGLLYIEGKGVQRDFDLGIKTIAGVREELIQLALSGEGRAQFNLGTMYNRGFGVNRDLKKGLEWIRQAAESGHAAAQYGLGMAFSYGLAVKLDPAEAAKWFQAAAEQGYPQAQSILAHLYATGNGVELDDLAALEWYEKAATQGDARAQVELGLRFQTGNNVVEDPQRAADWFRKASAQGDLSAHYHLAFLYVRGLGVPIDLNEALRLYRQAEHSSNPLISGPSTSNKLMLSEALKAGLPAKVNLKHIKNAAEAGGAKAQFHVGLMCERGVGGPARPADALKWYVKAAAQGQPNGQHRLAMLIKGLELDARHTPGLLHYLPRRRSRG